MTTKTLDLTDNAHCFVCGKSNVHGLQMVWATKGNKTQSTFYATKTHQGWEGLVHGGILAAVLDEAMVRLAWEKHGGAVTAELQVRYHAPVRIGEKLHVTGELGLVKKRLIPGKAEIRTSEGQLIASATGKALLQKVK